MNDVQERRQLIINNLLAELTKGDPKKKLPVGLVLELVIDRLEQIPDSNYSLQVKKEWQDVYAGLGIEADFSGLGEIQYRHDYWPVLVPRQLTLKELYRRINKKMKCQAPIALECSLDDIYHERTAETGAYYVYASARSEVPCSFLNKSYFMVANLGLKLMTPLERLALEAWYNNMTGSHLDLVHWTICGKSEIRTKLDGVTHYSIAIGWSSTHGRVRLRRMSAYESSQIASVRQVNLT